MPAGFKMVSFLRNYTDAMILQIDAVQTQVDTSVLNVMQSLQELSASTEMKKAEAEKALEATYLDPDAGTALMVESIQKSTDDIFEQAQRDEQSNGATVPSSSPEDHTDNVRRMGGLFSKHMESISTMDDSVRELVLTMVGCLSSADIVKQRLDHISELMRAMNLGLGNVILDLDARLNERAIATFKDSLLDFTYKNYTTEEERAAFKQIFGAPPMVRKAYDPKAS
jgi:hypothetical protein